MNAYRTRPNSMPWPPLILAATLLAAIALGYLHPLHVGFPLSRTIGVLLATLAITLDLWAMKALIEARTTVMPNRGSSHLVTCGPFRFSRNPIYFANIVLLAGLGLATGNGWLLPLALCDGLLTHFLAIRREESHLIALFGYKYEDYCRRVRRWI